MHEILDKLVKEGEALSESFKDPSSKTLEGEQYYGWLERCENAFGKVPPLNNLVHKFEAVNNKVEDNSEEKFLGLLKIVRRGREYYAGEEEVVIP